MAKILWKVYAYKTNVWEKKKGKYLSFLCLLYFEIVSEKELFALLQLPTLNIWKSLRISWPHGLSRLNRYWLNRSKWEEKQTTLVQQLSWLTGRAGWQNSTSMQKDSQEHQSSIYLNHDHSRQIVNKYIISIALYCNWFESTENLIGYENKLWRYFVVCSNKWRVPAVKL